MTAPQKGRIFINYRRADSEGYAGRIYDRLAPHFGADAVFMDVEVIDAGVDFVRVLEEAVQSCDVLVALIGRNWLNIKDAHGARRLDNPEDFVRVEISAALSRDIRVIPVLVGGAPMPGSAELPENLQPLTRRNALTVNHGTFHADMNRLIAHLERALEAAEASKVLKAKRTQEEQVRKERQAQIEKLLHQADTAINLSDWKLAGEKLKEILKIDAGHIEAQAKLELVEEKLTAWEEQKLLENREKEEARKRGKKREQEAAARARAELLAREKAEAEEKARRAALRRERQQESIAGVKTFFSSMGKLPLFMSGGIALLFILGYIISNIEIFPKPEPTKTPTASVLATATLSLPISTSFSISTSLPTETSTSTKIPATPDPSLGLGSTIVSEKDGMVLVYVPAGEFQMGSEDGSDDEKPIHTVYLGAFWIDQTEVTNAMYARCMESGKCNPPSSTKSSTRDSYYGNPDYDDYPVIYVSWNDAVAYCEWAGRRLPTEAEWEKAARWDENAQAQRVYPWGNSIDVGYVNYSPYVGDTTPVGSYENGASFHGAYDMAGNVWEWTSSVYRSYPYSATDGRDYLTASGDRVLRGGAWNSFYNGVRSANRSRYGSSSTSDSVGFRCASSAAAP